MNAASTYMRLEVISGNATGSTITVDDELVIGRHADGAGRLSDDEEISRQHARLSREMTGDYAIEDLGSSNGTFVNGLRIQSPRLLALGDSIEAGATTLLVREIVQPQPVESSPGTPRESASKALSGPTVARDVLAPQIPALAIKLEVDFDAREARLALGDGEEAVRMVFEDGGWRVRGGGSDSDSGR